MLKICDYCYFMGLMLKNTHSKYASNKNSGVYLIIIGDLSIELLRFSYLLSLKNRCPPKHSYYKIFCIIFDGNF